MKIEEQFTIDAPIDDVWTFVRDPATVAPCVPGCESVEPLSEKSYRSTGAVALARNLRSSSSMSEHLLRTTEL